MAECGENVGRGMIAYPCYLPSGHEGPHASVENDVSQRERKMWEEDRPAWDDLQEKRRIRSLPPEQQDAERARSHAASGLGEFQGVPQTTAQRYTENPTPHPGVTKESDESPAPSDTESMEPVCAFPLDVGYCVRSKNHIGEHWNGFAQDPPQPTVLGPEPQVVVYSEAPDGTATFEHVAPTKQREGDQPLPEVNDRQFIQDMVISDIEARKAVGISRYGTALQAHNGRDMLQDAYEEALDLAVYLRGVIEERDNPA